MQNKFEKGDIVRYIKDGYNSVNFKEYKGKVLETSKHTIIVEWRRIDSDFYGGQAQYDKSSNILELDNIILKLQKIMGDK